MGWLIAIREILSSRVTWVIGAFLAFLIWLHFHDKRIEDDATARCRAEHLAAATEEARRQSDVIFQASQDAEKRATANDIAIGKLNSEVEKARADLGKSRKNECRVPAAAGKRLSNIK